MGFFILFFTPAFYKYRRLPAKFSDKAFLLY